MAQVSQLIVLIILVIIGIVLFVLFLVELVNIPQPLVVPFADGTIIKIKSLANNLYLRPVPCSSFTCENPSVVQACLANDGNKNIVAAIGQADDPLTNWQLCQYSALSDTGEAKYLVYSESNQGLFSMYLDGFGSLRITGPMPICTQLKSIPIKCPTLDQGQGYFSFILNERAQSITNTTSGSYNIIPSCAITGSEGGFLISSGIGAISLPAADCPPLVLDIGTNIGCTGPEDGPRCALSYLFEIEVQS